MTNRENIRNPIAEISDEKLESIVSMLEAQDLQVMLYHRFERRYAGTPNALDESDDEGGWLVVAFCEFDRWSWPIEYQAKLGSKSCYHWEGLIEISFTEIWNTLPNKTEEAFIETLAKVESHEWTHALAHHANEVTRRNHYTPVTVCICGYEIPSGEAMADAMADTGWIYFHCVKVHHWNNFGRYVYESILRNRWDNAPTLSDAMDRVAYLRKVPSLIETKER